MVTTDDAMFVLLQAMVKGAKRDLSHPDRQADAALFLYWVLEFCGHSDPSSGLRRLQAAKRRGRASKR